jgi:hypothetical protein
MIMEATFEGGNNNLGRNMVLVLGVVIALIMFIAPKIGNISHSVKHHTADDVHSCLEQNGTWKTIQDGNDPNKFINICQFSEKKWGFQVFARIGESYEEITAYIADNFKSVDKLFNWISRRGYTEVNPETLEVIDP